MMAVRSAILVPQKSSRAGLRALVAPFEPVAAVYCSVAMPDQASAEPDRHARWRQLAAVLTAEGAGDDVVAAIGERVLAAPVAPATIAVFAVGSDHVESYLLRHLTMPDHAGYRVPAQILPLLRWQQRHPAHVVAAVNRAGADLAVADAPDRPARMRTVVGPDDEIALRAPGGRAGLSHNRFEHRVRDSWRHNAGAVAAAIVDEMRACDGEVLLLSGDPEMRREVVEQLPRQHSWDVRHVPRGRVDGGADDRSERVAEELLAAEHDRDAEVVRVLREELGPGGRAVQGWADTITALRNDQVALLVVSDRVRRSQYVWFGAAHNDVFRDVSEPATRGLPVRSGTGVDVAVRAALLSGGWVRVIDDGDLPAEGIGAVCRR